MLISYEWLATLIWDSVVHGSWILIAFNDLILLVEAKKQSTVMVNYVFLGTTMPFTNSIENERSFLMQETQYNLHSLVHTL